MALGHSPRGCGVSDLEDAGKPELNAAAIAPIPATRDIDLTPETDPENLARLSLALKELGARIRTEGVPGGLPFSHDAASLAAAEVWNLICHDGEFHISFHPSGFAEGYAQLAVNAHRLRVGEVKVVVADLADVIRSKESAGRPKDLRVLPLLYRHQSTRRGGMSTGSTRAPIE